MNESNSPKRQDEVDDLVRQDDAIAFRKAAVRDRFRRGAAAIFNEDPTNAPGQTKTFSRLTLMKETVVIASAARQVGDVALVDATGAEDGKPVLLKFKLDAEGELVFAGTERRA